MVSGISSGTLPFCSIIILIITITILIITIVRATTRLVGDWFPVCDAHSQQARVAIGYSLLSSISRNEENSSSPIGDVTALNKKERRLWAGKGKK